MTATILYLPKRPAPKVVQIHEARIPLLSAEDLALGNLNKLYRRALGGDEDSVSRIRVIKGYEMSPVLSRMAAMLLDDLGRRYGAALVDMPSDCEPEPAA